MKTHATPLHRGRLALVIVLLGAVTAFAQFVLGLPTPPELLFAWLGHLLGVPWIFNLVHALPWGLDAYAKYALLATAYLLVLAAAAAFALWSARRRHGALARLAWALGLALGGVGFVLMPLAGLGPLGLSPDNYAYPPLSALVTAALLAAGFALAPIGSTHDAPHETDGARRRQLKTLALFALAAALPSRAARAAGDLWQKIRGLSPEITPTKDHYQVSKNVVNPRLRAGRWRFEIKGMVHEPLVLTLDDLKALPAVERPSTLICISNPVGGRLMGNSVWTGVRLRDLLERVGVRPEASEVVLRAADNYSDSFPIDAALYEETILAYLQNGEPLTPDHGYPARLLVPGIYGMKNVKWLTSLELVGEDHQGYWQKRGWSDVAVVRTMSRIDTGVATPTGDGRVAIGGVAFAGRRGVRAVEVSFDEGATWEAAELKPTSSRITWTLWRYVWKARPGDYAVSVRAIDGEGRTQDPTPRPPLPDGATGYHRRKVRVV